METRVRFAPSPTGPLHIGGVRTALYNYLFARKNKGVFILRVEDTDQNRYVEGSEKYIQEALEWTGMVPDEGPFNGGNYGPYRQSERKEIYQKYIAQLIETGKAYYAFDKTETLSIAREEAERKGETFKYGAQNRMSFENSLTLTKDEVKKRLTAGYVVRLKVDSGQKINVFDEIRGAIQQSSDLLDDKILMKADGMPTYHFANVVDDHLMEITTVIRGEEWLPSLPIHQLIYDAFGWNAPQFMHLPLILKPSGKGKLSKRDGDKEGYPVFPLNWGDSSVGFKESGFLPEGFVNYLTLLGWNRGTEQEIYTLTELEGVFGVEGIQKGGARFDFEKAKWVNHQHLVNMMPEQLLQLDLIKEQLHKVDANKQLDVLSLVKERLFTLTDLASEIEWLVEPENYDARVVQKLEPKHPKQILEKGFAFIENTEDMESLKETLLPWAKENNINTGVLMQSLRIALVGKLSGPDLFQICALLGKNVTLKRITKAILFLN
jgi:glutamyl-tRNA synthetase